MRFTRHLRRHDPQMRPWLHQIRPSLVAATALSGLPLCTTSRRRSWQRPWTWSGNWLLAAPRQRDGTCADATTRVLGRQRRLAVAGRTKWALPTWPTADTSVRSAGASPDVGRSDRTRDGVRVAWPETYARRADAVRVLAELERQSQVAGNWLDVAGSKVLFAAYADEWINRHPRLGPRTADVYRSLIRRHLAPRLGQIPLGQLDTATVREWRAGLLEAGVSSTMVAKSYRLLRAILNTAVAEDELIIVNPCRIKGAGEERASERPVLTLDQLYALVDLMPDRWKAFLLLKTFASLRWGEITALTRNDLDLERCTVRIRRQFLTMPGGLQLGPPKSRAGIRMVSFPAAILPELHHHLDAYSPDGPDGLVFVNEHGQPWHRGTSIPQSAGGRLASRLEPLTSISTTCDTPATRWPLVGCQPA
jgi:integrase